MVSVILHPCMLCVALSMDLLVLRVCELFGETIHNMINFFFFFLQWGALSNDIYQTGCSAVMYSIITSLCSVHRNDHEQYRSNGE